MIKPHEIELKLNALKISGDFIALKENDFYYDYIIRFDPDITINKVKARISDLELFFGDKIILGSYGRDMAFRVAKNSRPVIDLRVDFKPFIEDSREGLPLALGQDGNGKKLYTNLCKAPHILVSGATGSGKSVFLHDCILSVLYTGRSDLILIDTKRVEFNSYNGLNPLLFPVVNDVDTATDTLYWLCREMNRRYKLFEKTGARNIQEYTAKNKMKYITVVIDEFSDLIMQNKKIIESYIVRLAQLGRACGIHLIIATQTPRKDVITGLIKANIPSRVAFNVASAMDSRVIIDRVGAEKLNRNGDGLYIPVGSQNPIRFQAPYITTENITAWVRNYKKIQPK